MSAGKPAYAEFGMRSNFSFLEGASRPEAMVLAAYKHGYRAAGLADRNTVSGTVRAWSQAKAEPIAGHLAYHPGARLVFADGTPDVLAYPRDRAGWGRLCRMLTHANFEGEKGAPKLLRDDLWEWGDGMSLAVLPPLEEGSAETSLGFLREVRERFGQAARVAAAPLYNGSDRLRFAQGAALAQAAGLPLMATGDALAHSPDLRPLQDVLTAIRLKTTVMDAGFALEANAERFLKPPAEMVRLFRGHPEAIQETLRFAEEVSFSFKELWHNYPDEPTRDGASAQEELERLTWEGAEKRFPGAVEKHRKTLEHELALIASQDYARYFLTVHDIVRFAREQAILCQGRGSAANSVVCYCLGITEVGPELGTCLFERFISEERKEPPDIDVDFEHERRSEVMQYIYRKYDEKHTALACAVISYQARSSMREVAKALGYSADTLAALAASTWRWSANDLGDVEARDSGLSMADANTRRLFALANALGGSPRHLSQHVGGFVITKDRLDEIVPVMKTGMPDRKMVEWDKDDLDAVGLLKVDILALGMLSCLRRCFDLLRDHYPAVRVRDLDAIPKEQRSVYAMIQRADTLGVFQIESRAQMSMLPRLKPKKFYDLVIEVAIVRPGPIQGDMVHPYLRRREGKEEVEYPKPELEKILRKTKGVPLFQEQIMRIAVDAAGFKPGEADQLRRSMATFKRTGTIETHQKRFIEGMIGNNYTEDFAKRCFEQIKGFAEYGFPESHAASFALLVYASCWFKAWYPDVFCAAILNSQPMGFYAPAQLVRDAAEHGIEIRPVDVNHSEWDCTLEDWREPGGRSPFSARSIHARHTDMKGVIRSRFAVRLGFRQVKGLREAEMTQLVSARGRGYDSLRDLWLRTRLPAGTVTRLAEADAFRSLGLDRREALWAAQALDKSAAAEHMPLFDRAGATLFDHEPEARLPPMSLGEHVVQDYRTLSLSLKAHPVSFLRQKLHAARTRPAADLLHLPSGQRIAVAGLVLVRQRPGSARGVIFLTIEDETGAANVIVWPKCFEQFRAVVLGARLTRVYGRLQKQGGVIHLIAEQVEDFSSWLGLLSSCGEPLRPELAHADEFKRPIPPSRASRPLEQRSDGGELAATAQRVMPKGRNFH